MSVKEDLTKLLKGKNWKRKIPFFLSVLVLFAVVVINSFVVFSSRGSENFKIFSNILMFIITIIEFLCVGLPSKNDTTINDLENIFENILIPVIAFPMNIDIFGYKIRQKQFLADLCSWHLLWIFCIVVQILFLSNLGTTLLKQSKELLKQSKELLKQSKELLKQIKELLLWGKKIAQSLGNIVLGIFKMLENCDEKILLLILAITFIWGIGVISQIRNEELRAILSNENFWLINMYLLATCIIVGFLLYIIPSLYRKGKNFVEDLEGQIVIIVIAGIAVLAALYCMSQIWAKTLGMIILILAVLLCVILIIRVFETHFKQREEDVIKQKEGNEKKRKENRVTKWKENRVTKWKENRVTKWKESRVTKKKENKVTKRELTCLKDFAVIVLAFLVIPLTVTIIVTIVFFGGWQILSEGDMSFIAKCKNFGEAASNAIKSLSQLFNTNC